MSDRFDPAIYEKKRVTVSQTSSWFQVEFVLPEEVRETMPLSELRSCHGKHVVELDNQPFPGNLLLYPNKEEGRSFFWRVVGVVQFPRRRKSRQPRIVSEVLVEFVKEKSDDFS